MEQFLEMLVRAKARAYTLLVRSSFSKMGTDTVIVPPFRFHGLRHVQVGSGVIIHSGCWIQTITSETSGVSPLLVVRDNVNIGMNATISAARNITIEEHVLLGRNVFITDHGHEFRDISVPIDRQGITRTMDVCVGAETWIGQNAVILPGASIGRHCVIGANSVVNSVVPDYCVAAGTPAKVVKRYNPATSCWEPALPHG
jgi:acetyltransferase-like isoleucine patch superfamily enzyme